MAVVNLSDLDNVTIDGNSQGDIFNAYQANPEAAVDIMAALKSLIAIGTKAVSDNEANKARMVDYLQATDGGKAAGEYLVEQLKAAKIAGLQAELAALQTPIIP